MNVFQLAFRFWSRVAILCLLLGHNAFAQTNGATTSLPAIHAVNQASALLEKPIIIYSGDTSDIATNIASKADAIAWLNRVQNLSGSQWHGEKGTFFLPQGWIPRYMFNRQTMPVEPSQPHSFLSAFLSSLSANQIAQLKSKDGMRLTNFTPEQQEILVTQGGAPEGLGSQFPGLLKTFNDGFLQVRIKPDFLAFFKGRQIIEAGRIRNYDFLTFEKDLLPPIETVLPSAVKDTLQQLTVEVKADSPLSFEEVLQLIGSADKSAASITLILVSKQLSKSKFLISSGKWPAAQLLQICCLAARAEVRQLGEQLIVAPHSQVVSTLVVLEAPSIHDVDDPVTRQVEEQWRKLQPLLARFDKDAADYNLILKPLSSFDAAQVKQLRNEIYPPLPENLSPEQAHGIRILKEFIVSFDFHKTGHRQSTGLGPFISDKWVYLNSVASTYGKVKFQ